MGNKVPGCNLPFAKNGKHLNTYLSPEQIQLVQGSWQLIKHNLAELGLVVFLRFFETEPNMKGLFPKIVKMNNENKLEWDIDREMLQKHAVTVMEGLGAAVESLDESEFLNSVLISIGQTHIQRQVKPQMLRKLWPSLHYGLQEVMKDAYTKQVSDAWKKVFDYKLWPSLHYGLQKVMKDAYTKQVSDAWKKVFDYICVYMKLGMENPDMDPDNPIETNRR